MNPPPIPVVTASVSERTPIPERPTLYMVIWPTEASWKGYTHPTDNLAWAKDVHSRQPGAVLLTIPDSSPSPKAEPKPDSAPVAGKVSKSHTYNANNPEDMERFVANVQEQLRPVTPGAVRPEHDLCITCGHRREDHRGARNAGTSACSRICTCCEFRPLPKPAPAETGGEDIVKRLRGYTGSAYAELAADEAADTIARLRKERDEAIADGTQFRLALSEAIADRNRYRDQCEKANRAR